MTCTCMTEDPGDGLGERVVTHSGGCPEHPEYQPDGPEKWVPEAIAEQEAYLERMRQEAVYVTTTCLLHDREVCAECGLSKLNQEAM